MRRLFLVSLVLLSLFSRYATCDKGELVEYVAPSGQAITPWLTGPLLAPSGHTIPPGYMNIEPYLFVNTTYAQYDNHWKSHSKPNFYSVMPQISVQIGLTDFMDFQITPTAQWQETRGRSATRFADLPVGFDFQLVQDGPGKWWPAIKLSLTENVPVGKYENLNPAKLGTDVSGTGSYITGVSVVIARMFHTGGLHFLSARLGNTYSIPASTNVRGFNAYGGGYGTSGKVYPGQSWKAVLGLEYSLTQNWALALDIQNVYAWKTRFKGTSGRTASGARATVGAPASNQFSLAPAIEYNWSENLGIIAGCWFTATGKNTGDFAQGVVAVNIFFPVAKSVTQPLDVYPSDWGGGGGGR